MSARGQRYRKALDAVQKLQKKLQSQEQKLLRLHEEREVLYAREHALNALVHCHTALLRVTQPLRELLDARPDGGVALSQWAAKLRELESVHGIRGGDSSSGSSPEASSASGSGGDGAAAAARGGGGGGPNGDGELPSWARLVAEKIEETGPELLLRQYSGFTGQDLAHTVKSYYLEAAGPLFRVRAGAEDAAGDKALLQRLHDRMFSVVTCALVAAPNSLVELNMLQLDTMAEIIEPRPEQHWTFVVRQMQMTRHQFLAMEVALDLYEAHIRTVLARRAALMSKQEQCADDADEQFNVLMQVAACQAEFVWSVVSTGHAVYDRILDPTQSAAAIVAAYPQVPTFLGLRRALATLRAEEHLGIGAPPPPAAAERDAAAAAGPPHAAAAGEAAPRPPPSPPPPTTASPRRGANAAEESPHDSDAFVGG